MMSKYLHLIKNTWHENFAYRLNFIMWRVRVVIRFLITYSLWSSIYHSASFSFFGYNRESMLTYVLLVFLVNSFVLATRTQEMGVLINEGGLTNYLTKPINFFVGVASRDMGDKLLNFIFSVIEFTILIAIFRPPIFIQTNPMYLATALLALCGSVMLYFFISLLLGFIGFWTTEVWAVRFIFIILMDFLAGNFFPIDILPKFVGKILLLTPFPYILYFPVQIYLGRLEQSQIVMGFAILIVWLFLTNICVKYVWKKGLQIYSAEGR